MMDYENTPPVEAAPAEARWYPETEQTGESGAEPGSPSTEPAAAGAPVAGPPEKYELAMEGVQLDPGMLTAAEPVLRELGLSNEGANKLLPVATKLMTGAREQTMQAMIDAGAKQKKEWFAAFASDPQIGGAGRAETQRLAEQGLTAAGFKAGHPFRQLLNDSGLGNHPDMIRTFRRLGELAGVGGHNTGSGAAATTDAGVRWYGSGVRSV